ncbi:hypothetical protein ACVIIV_003223 [Bradyrhizobium sp. USDA 4354]
MTKRSLGRGFLQDLDFTIDAQRFRYLLCELGVAIFKVAAHLVRLDLLTKDLAHFPGAKRRPQLRPTTIVFGLVTRQRHQPGFGLRRDRWLLARSLTIIVGGQRAIGQCSLDTALHRLMMDPKSLAHRAERGIFSIRQQHLGSRYRLASSVLDHERAAKVDSAFTHNSTARRHLTIVQLLVSPTANVASASNPSVPSIHPAPQRRLHEIGRLVLNRREHELSGPAPISVAYRRAPS